MLLNYVEKFPWRQVTAFFFAALVCTALWAEVQQADLAEKIIRLHVIANSDSAADQALKLQVRDEILLQAEDLLTEAESPQEAASLLEDNLHILAQTASMAARQAGQPCAVRVCLEETWFPTKQCGDLSLPAGEYQALRVILGDGEGRNWWCVTFPSLCVPATGEDFVSTAVSNGFDEETVRCFSDPDTYRFRFFLLEQLGKLEIFLKRK
jgi:stage II sporulation protein R